MKTAARPRPALHLAVFSKDRACQLDSLLRSIRDNLRVPLAGVTVLYRVSDDTFARAYRLLASRRYLDGICWVREVDFRADLLLYLSSLPATGFIMPLVDDDIMYRPLACPELFERFSERHLFISLRCSRRYAGNTPPRFVRTEPVLEWRWNYGRRKRLVWNYPFSLDGNVFHVSHFRRAVAAIPFKGPNSLEGRLHRYRHTWWVKRTALALAPAESVVVNNPLNRVQTEGETWHKGLDPAAFNQRYLAGEIIDNERLYTQPTTGVHTPLDVVFLPA
jgi:hypothetical protein